MDNWDEVRTAFQVARMGTVSGAAEVLGVHHATVIRHIDALEGRLGVKLFQRHSRGYTPTEAGEDLLRVARATDDQFSQLAGRIKGRGNEVTGELVVTALAEFSRILAPILATFQNQHPGLVVRLKASERLFRLEYGEAHVAIRAGQNAPGEPDNVVQKLLDQPVGLYASEAYVDRHGRPSGPEDLGNHLFVSTDDPSSRAPFAQWLRTQVAEDRIAFRADDFRAQEEAVLAGAGIGFMAVEDAAQVPHLLEVMAPRQEWAIPLWIVTHMDLHRTAKVQAFLKHLKQTISERHKP